MVYKAIISGHVYRSDEGADIEVLTHIDNDHEDTEIFDAVEQELFLEFQNELDYTDDYYFVAVVYAKFIKTVTFEGTEYDVDYQVVNIECIEDLDTEEDF